jgi:hypothetical protein
MLLSNRRNALIHLCIAGMQAAWILPFWLLAYRTAAPPVVSYIGLLAVLLAWMLVLELMSRTALQRPLYDMVTLGLIFVTSLLAVRVLLYGGTPLFSLSWLPRAFSETLRFSGILPPALAIVGVNLLLWQRATSATSRDLNFFGVGLTFRSGLLLMILGGGIYTTLVGPALAAPALAVSALLPLVWLYFALGLVAVSLARIGEKASEAQSAGEVLPPRRLAQVLAAVGVTVTLLAGLTLAYTPDSLRRGLHVLDPLWRLLRPVLMAVLVLVMRILNPVLLWLEALVAGWMRGALPEQAAPPPASGTPGRPNPLDSLPSWSLDLIRNALIVLVIVVVVIGGIAFLLLYLEKVRKATGIEAGEEEDTEQATFGSGILQRGLDSLRRAARLARRFGMSRELLAAISVENIYANLCRIARQRGHARLSSQPPDAYLPVLARAFPGSDDRLRRITHAYMRVHYGDHQVTRAELVALRADYRALREAETAAPNSTNFTKLNN